MLKAFCFKHWGHGGEGSGETVVVSYDERTARQLISLYFQGKPEGYRQCTNVDLLECEPLEDSGLSTYPVPLDEARVVIEYHYPDMKKPYLLSVVFIGTPADELAGALDQLQASKNDGRGVSCVQTICLFLRRGELTAARAVVNNEADKIRRYEDIVAVLKTVGFWYELKFD